ncbi:MAG: sugar phosphate isomerase/epimerase [Victivallaceae bacterium]
MIHLGTCSITLAELTPPQVIDCCKKAGLAGIEWWGKQHVPHGDIATAEYVGKLTREAGLSTCSYGSYYRAGISENEGLHFSKICETAVALGVPAIRVWAGDRGPDEADSAYFQAVVDDLLRIADIAEKSDVVITIEYHGGTLTDTHVSVGELLKRADHPGVMFSWQPPIGLSEEECLCGLNAVLPRLGTIHVFHWSVKKSADFGVIRHPLIAGSKLWRRYLDMAASSGREHWALLEFVKDNDPGQFIEDAAVLHDLIRKTRS